MEHSYSVLIVIFYTGSFPPPDEIFVRVEQNQIIFSWNPVPLYCSALSYSTTTIDCGTCITNTLTNTSCTDFQTTTSGILCVFSVRSVICGNITGTATTSYVNLKGVLVCDSHHLAEMGYRSILTLY